MSDTLPASALKLGGRKDLIVFDEQLSGFGYRLRQGAGGKLLKSFIAQYRHAGATRRVLLGPASTLKPEQARQAALPARWSPSAAPAATSPPASTYWHCLARGLPTMPFEQCKQELEQAAQFATPPDLRSEVQKRLASLDDGRRAAITAWASDELKRLIQPGVSIRTSQP